MARSITHDVIFQLNIREDRLPKFGWPIVHNFDSRPLVIVAIHGKGLWARDSHTRFIIRHVVHSVGTNDLHDNTFEPGIGSTFGCLWQCLECRRRAQGQLRYVSLRDWREVGCEDAVELPWSGLGLGDGGGGTYGLVVCLLERAEVRVFVSVVDGHVDVAVLVRRGRIDNEGYKNGEQRVWADEGRNVDG
jgi:hypothetical protein